MVAFNQKLYSKLPFIVSPYRPDDSGTLLPEIPDRCPKSDELKCGISFKSKRIRKCGPLFPLIRLFCKTHTTSFTVYPSGWFPFVRASLLPVNEDGTWHGDYSLSFFSCILALCCGERWGEETTSQTPSRKTQGRHISALFKLFSLDSEEVCHETAETLGLDALGLRDIANGIREGPSLIEKAKGVRAILDSLKFKAKNQIPKLLHLGHACSFWGPPLTF